MTSAETMSFRFPPDVRQAVRDAAESTGLSATDVVTRILRRGLRLPDGDALDAYLDTLAAEAPNDRHEGEADA